MHRKHKASALPLRDENAGCTHGARLVTQLPHDEALRERRFRALYAQPPDFRDLARRDPDFAATVKGRELDFRDPHAVMQLTKTLLKLDFGIKISLPNNRLCPPVPNRHNYILWLKDLLDTSTYDQPGQKLTGLDIGTGASCIYPLLGCAQRPWSFIATDVDAESLRWARQNVEQNDLTSRVKLLLRTPEDALIPAAELSESASVAFTMTNPPFYESEAALLLSASRKQRPPHTACTGSAAEMVTAGGELAFVRRILHESVPLGPRIQWYTAMFGFLSSVTAFVDSLRQRGVGNYAVTEFLQGTKTRRWAVAWSFAAMRPAQAVARGTRSAPSSNILPPVTEMEFPAADGCAEHVGAFSAAVVAAIGALDLLSWEWQREACEGVGRAPGRVWARAWRRRKRQQQQQQQQEALVAGAESNKCEFGFRVWIRVSVSRAVWVGCRWVEGFDAAAFESFQGFLKALAKDAAAAAAAAAAAHGPSSSPADRLQAP